MFLIILKQFIVNIFLPVAIQTVKTYIKSTDSKNDDKLLEVTKIGAKYLAEKTNNTVTVEISRELNSSSMVLVQKSRLI